MSFPSFLPPSLASDLRKDQIEVLEWEGEFLLLLGGHVFLLEEGAVEGREKVTRDDEAADAGDDLRERGREGRREGGREGGVGRWADMCFSLRREPSKGARKETT